MQQVYRNAPLFVVYPKLIFSTNNTVKYIFEGKVIKQDQFRLVSNTSQQHVLPGTGSGEVGGGWWPWTERSGRRWWTVKAEKHTKNMKNMQTLVRVF